MEVKSTLLPDLSVTLVISVIVMIIVMIIVAMMSVMMNYTVARPLRHPGCQCHDHFHCEFYHDHYCHDDRHGDCNLIIVMMLNAAT